METGKSSGKSWQPSHSRHVVKRQPPTALEKESNKRKETKAQGKLNFFLARVKK